MIQPIASNERPAVVRLLALSFLAAASYTLSRTVGDSLFLARLGNENLPLIFVFSGISTATLASLWHLLTRRLRMGQILFLTSLLFATITITAALLLPTMHHSLWLIGGIYLLTEAKGAINAINIVAAMNETLGSHASRTAWARVGLGVPLASLTFGLLIGVEVQWLTLPHWLLVSGLLDVACLFVVWSIRSVRVPRPQPLQVSSSRTPISDQVRKRYTNPRKFHFWIALLIAAKVVVLTLITFEWKISVNDFFRGDEQALSRYFGMFYAVVGVATLTLQGIVTVRLLHRRRFALPILLMPMALLAVNLVLLAGTGVLFRMLVTSLGKSVESWRRSVHDTTLNLLYTKIERARRRSTIAINNAVVKPLSEVGASLVLLAGSTLLDHSVLLTATIVWLVATAALLKLIHGPAIAYRDRSLGSAQRHQTASAAAVYPDRQTDRT